MDPIEYLTTNYKISKLVNFCVSSRQYDAYFNSLQCISEGKVNFNIFAKKLILYNYCLMVDDNFETRVIHAINKGFLTKKYTIIEKDIFSLISNPKFEIFVEVLDPLLVFINYLIRDNTEIFNESKDSTIITINSNNESTNPNYKEFIQSLSFNFHLFVKDSKFPIFNHLTNILEYFKSNKLEIPEYNYTLKLIQDIMEKNSYKKSHSLINNILCATDQFCGVFCYYMSNSFKFQDCKNTIISRINSHLKSLQYTKISELSHYMIQLIKDISHLSFHTDMKIQQYNDVLKEFNFPAWMKDSVMCNLTSIPYYELKYMLGIPYSFTYESKHDIYSDFDRYFCFNIEHQSVKLFSNLSSCLNCMSVKYEDEKGNIDEEKEKSKKSNQLNKLILSRLPSPGFVCSIIHPNLPELKESEFNNMECFNGCHSEFPKYYDKRDFIVSKLYSGMVEHISGSIDHIKKDSELMKQKYIDILKCRFINEEDTLYTSIYDWDPEYLIFENDGKDNIHVFTPAEYEQLFERDMNFYNRQPLDLLNKFKISNSLKLYNYSKFPRLPILVDFNTYLNNLNVEESKNINDSNNLMNWLSTTFKDLHTRMINHHLTTNISSTKYDFLPRISHNNRLNNPLNNPLTNSLMTPHMLLRMLFQNDEEIYE
jgi:hypothetical protein